MINEGNIKQNGLEHQIYSQFLHILKLFYLAKLYCIYPKHSARYPGLKIELSDSRYFS